MRVKFKFIMNGKTKTLIGDKDLKINIQSYVAIYDQNIVFKASLKNKYEK